MAYVKPLDSATTEFDQQIEIAEKMLRKINLSNDYKKKVRLRIESVLALFSEINDKDFAIKTRDFVFVSLYDYLHERLMWSLFEKTAGDRSATAWVAATDGIGYIAQDFLKAKLNPKNQRISLVGFDNGQTTVTRHLTSYDFDMAGQLQHALLFAIGREKISARSPRTLEWPGILYQRQSSFKV